MDDWESIFRLSCARGLEAKLFVECLDVWEFYPNCLVFQPFQIEREPEAIGRKRPSRHKTNGQLTSSSKHLETKLAPVAGWEYHKV